MANPFEKPPTLTPEKPEPEKPEVEKLEKEKEPEEKPLIEVVTPIGTEKRTPEQIEKARRIIEEIEQEREIREKLKRGELLTKEEATRLREIELIARSKEREKEVREKEKPEEKPEEKLEEEKEKPEEKAEEKLEEVPEKEISLEDLEKNLEERRAAFIEADKDYRQVFGRMKLPRIFFRRFYEKKELAFERIVEPARKYIKAGDSEILKDEKSPQYSEAAKRKEDFIEELLKGGIKKEKAEAIYNAELKKAEYDGAKEELGKKMLAEGKKEAEIFQKLIVEEKEILNQAKVETWPPKEKNLFRKGLEWWMRRGTATRLLISTGLVTGVVAATGGFSAPAIALFAGQRYIRGAGAVLVSKLTGKGVDWAMEKNIKAKEEAALGALKKEFSLENLREVDKKYEKILEDVAGKRRRKLIVKAGVMAATGAGAALGLGWLEGYLGARVVPPVEAPPKVPPPEEVVPQKVPPPEEVVPKVEVMGVEVAQKGDSIWRMTERQLEARYGEKFTGLDEARKTYVIDAIKNRIAAEPEKFCLTDIDKIKIGQKVDFSSIFEDKTEIDKFFERADILTDTQIKNIAHNNEVLRNWLAEHPGEKLTSEKVEEILTKGKVIPSAEVAPPVKEALPAEVLPPEKVMPPVEAPSEKIAEEIERMKEEIARMNLERVMDFNEAANVKAIGLTSGEYEAIQNLKVGKLLEEIPSKKEEAWAIWRGEIPGKTIDLPHHGIYGSREFGRHIKLAEFIRSFELGPEIQEMTVRQFLRMVGPDGVISF